MCDIPRIQVSGSEGAMQHYCQALREAGGLPLPAYAPAPDLSCAGLVLCGGGDIDPARFGQENRGSDPPDPVRDEAELALFRAFFQAGRPIFGICRGMQLINVALGGSLIQDLPTEQKPFHGQGRYVSHSIRAAEDSLLGTLYGPLFLVNSYHHQAVDRLGAGLRPTAWAESGFVEAFEHESLPIRGVQFHPERMAYANRRPDTVDGAPLFLRFVEQCRQFIPDTDK